jgi:succinate dehydrogenase / fumarate reductase, membrane anchor subunit
MVKRVVTGAHYGFRDWLMQRITAVVMAVYTPVFLIALCARSPVTYESWKSLFGQTWMQLATFLFLVSVCLHAWVGVRDILMDYVKPVGARLTLEVLVIIALVGCGGWAVETLWRI